LASGLIGIENFGISVRLIVDNGHWPRPSGGCVFDFDRKTSHLKAMGHGYLVKVCQFFHVAKTVINTGKMRLPYQ
jgi:hypothetical protein